MRKFNISELNVNPLIRSISDMSTAIEWMFHDAWQWMTSLMKFLFGFECNWNFSTQQIYLIYNCKVNVPLNKCNEKIVFHIWSWFSNFFSSPSTFVLYTIFFSLLLCIHISTHSLYRSIHSVSLSWSFHHFYFVLIQCI